MNGPRDAEGLITFVLKAGAIVAAGWALLVGILGIALSVPVRSLLLVWLLLVWSGLVGLTLIYWARKTSGVPSARRFALAMFVSLNLTSGSILVGAIHAGIMSRASALYVYGSAVLACSLIGAATAFEMVRRGY